MELAEIVSEKMTYPTLTSGHGRKRKRGTDGNGADTGNQADTGPLGEQSVQASIKEAGYKLTDNMLLEPFTPVRTSHLLHERND